MFPYPSGNIHMGHVRNYVAADVIARYKRQQGYDVIYPMGWDAFGMPAENAAIAHGQQPAAWTEQNIAQMKGQIQAMGTSIDWSREIYTNDPDYYRWTQWFFVEMFKREIAYQADSTVNWDPVDQTVISNEQIDTDGRAWRSGAIVEQRTMTQWHIRITDYADEMMADIDSSGMPAKAKAIQRNWIAKMHDWCISRQRYWGTPIPIIHCPEHGPVAVPAEQMPVTFPTPDRPWANYGEQIEKWKHTTCPICGGPAHRETDTMDTFVDSAWYFYRYADPHNTERPFAPDKAAQWMPMDIYIGGIEHANAHMIYARFFSRFIRDIGMSDRAEPFSRYIPIGMVQGETFRDADGRYISAAEADPNAPGITRTIEKMSKSKGNGIDPMAMIERHGAAAIRMHMMFAAPIDRDMVWTERGINGIKRFIRRIEAMDATATGPSHPDYAPITTKAIADYEREMDNYKFNTAISKTMAFSKTIAAWEPSPERQQAIAVIHNMITPFTGG
jgi:leucyl-tRNA synthetase